MDKPRRNKPTNAELSILQVLWQNGPATVRDVHSAMSATREIGYTTVLKLMQIMTEKGLVTREDQGRAHLYRPVDTANCAKRDLVDDLMERAFGGSASQLMLHALDTKRTTPEELAEIRRLIDRLEESRG